MLTLKTHVYSCLYFVILLLFKFTSDTKYAYLNVHHQKVITQEHLQHFPILQPYCMSLYDTPLNYFVSSWVSGLAWMDGWTDG